MPRAIKRTLAVGAMLTVAVAVALPATADADQWTEAGAQYNGPAHVVGSLTQTLNANGATSTCDVEIAAQLSNTGVPPLGVADAQVLSVSLSNCATSLPSCNFNTIFGGLPWSLSTSGASVTTTGVLYGSTYSGSACPLNGSSVVTDGTVTGESVPSTNIVQFIGATGLSTSYGPATLNGAVEIFVEDGTTSRPIELS